MRQCVEPPPRPPTLTLTLPAPSFVSRSCLLVFALFILAPLGLALCSRLWAASPCSLCLLGCALPCLATLAWLCFAYVALPCSASLCFALLALLARLRLGQPRLRLLAWSCWLYVGSRVCILFSLLIFPFLVAWDSFLSLALRAHDYTRHLLA